MSCHTVDRLSCSNPVQIRVQSGMESHAEEVPVHHLMFPYTYTYHYITIYYTIHHIHYLILSLIIFIISITLYLHLSSLIIFIIFIIMTLEQQSIPRVHIILRSVLMVSVYWCVLV